MPWFKGLVAQQPETGDYYAGKTTPRITGTDAKVQEAIREYVKNNGYAKIFDLDDKLLKHNNDCMFYEHTIYSKNATESKKAVAEARYELSKEQADIIIDELYDIVLTSI